MARLSQLAADPHGARRGDIYLAIVSLYQTQAMRLSERERTLMREILQRLAGDVEMAIRISLAERLADDDSAPLDLILMLADDRIEVARPIILRSQQISDADLLTLLEHVGEEHQAACAARPHIGRPVCETLAQSGSETVLVALIRNATAQIAPGTFETLIEKSREMEALQSPLAQREDLPADLATKMCEWVSEALKAQIRIHYPATAPTVAAKLDAATQAVQSQPAAAANDLGTGSAKLIEKLAAAGQLRAGFLLRVLHQGQIELFELAFAKLLQLEIPQLRRALYENGVTAVALACRAVGIDRCVFSTVFNLSRQAQGVHPNLTAQDKIEIESIFKSFSKVEALNRVRNLATAEA